MVINTQKENFFDQTIGIEALSEIITNPVDILGAAIGGKIGHTLSKKCKNKKLSSIMTGLGVIIGFLPVAVMEAKFTKEQKLAEKIGTMKAIKELDNSKKFASKEKFPIEFIEKNKKDCPNIFAKFIN